MGIRITREQRRERTRSDLLEAAREVFLRRGFHVASLDEIAEEAGYTKGAVYSNFKNKDELFLAVLDLRLAERLDAYREFVFDQQSVEDAYRAVARFMTATDEAEPRWTPLVLEFWPHAARHEQLRKAVVEQRRRFVDAIAGIVRELASRHGVAYRIPVEDVARGSGALARGIALERLLDPGAIDPDVFEEMHVAYMHGLTEPDGKKR
jgi:AcrR family transcriptional regulator